MTAPTLGKRVRATHAVLALGRRVRTGLSADLTARLRANGVQNFVDSAGQRWKWSSFKTRYVRTVAGSKWYGLPIGSPIVGKGVKRGGGSKSESGVKPTAPAPPPEPKPKAAGKPKPAPVGKPAEPKTAGGKIKLTPAQRAAAEQHLGREPGAGRGAHLDGNQLVVEDRDTAVKELDRVLAGSDLTPGERKSRKNLRDKIAAHDGGDAKPSKPQHKPDAKPASTPEPAAEPSPEAPAPAPASKLSHEELAADWEKNGPKLSDKEAEAVKEYADAGFYEMNGLLRGNLTDLEERDTDAEYTKRVEAEYRDKVNAVRDVQNRYRTPGPATLYRRVPHGVLPDDTMQPGDVFRDKAFLSTSTRKNPGTFTNHPVLMEIDVPAGTPAINVNAAGYGIPAEQEILLPPGLKLQVVSDETKDGQRWVKMSAVPL